MKHHFVGIILASTLLLAAVGCNKIVETVKTKPAYAATEADFTRSGLADADSRFGFSLFHALEKDSPDKNIFISPASIATALQMTYNGAAGTTKEEMAKALQLNGMSLDEMNKANAALVTMLQEVDPKVKLSLANSLWLKKGFELKPDFVKRNTDFYAAKLDVLDFASPSALSTINGWVSDQTNGKIDKLIDRINSDSVLFLINAIYFKGAWQDEFDKGSTQDAPFKLASGARTTVPMMNRSGDFSYLENEDFQAVKLPYGKGRIGMYVFLPSGDLETFQKKLTAVNWNTWIRQFGKSHGSLSLPKFKMEYEAQLNDSLKSLGMGEAFEDYADFSGMIKGNGVCIDEVKHKAVVEVNEEGTEAAAGTSVGMKLTAMPMERGFNMVVDRPFFFAIRDDKTGALLFMGSVNNPGHN